MTVISSLFSGISGIVSNGSALSVAGDNIANMSTPAFKSSVPVFESALSQRIGEAEVGLGSRLAGTTANFEQGSFQSTTRGTDLAIEGKGFFIVRNGSGDQFYTRAGSFETDESGNLVTSAGGFVLQGYAIDSSEQVSGTLSAVNFESVSSAPESTQTITYALNLDSSAEIPTTNDWSTFTSAASSSNYSYSQTVYDDLGNARSVTTYFRKTAANSWEYRTMTDAENISNRVSGTVPDGTPIIVKYGTLSFNTNGTLQAHNAGAALSLAPVTEATGASATTFDEAITANGLAVTNSAALGLRWVGATPAIGTNLTANDNGDFSITHEFGDEGASLTQSDTTQFAASASTIKSVTQDGRAQGNLQSIEVLGDGTVRGNFSNGAARDLYKVPLATFTNEGGLIRSGGNLYAESGTSGQAQIGLAAAAGRGQVRAFRVEQSNVDLASEFVRIITYQRAFQASSRTVSTAAELLQELVNLGR
jgi:flagellar hook protein FlgE